MCLINLDNIRGEKEYYMKEYQRLLDQTKGRPEQFDDVVSKNCEWFIFIVERA